MYNITPKARFSSSVGNGLFNSASLDLFFAKTKSLVDATTGTNLIDFTRASSGTYVGSDGLIKTATTNYLLQSEDFSTTWTASNLTVATNQIPAPTGVSTADLVTGNAGTNIKRMRQNVVTTNLGPWTFSIWLKSNTASKVLIILFDSAAGGINHVRTTLSFSTGALSGTSANGTATNVSAAVQNFGNGWYRVSITGTFVTALTSVFAEAWLEGYTSTASETSFYIWGAQLEQSSTVGEYVKTTSTINSAPRFDHDPTTGESLGLLVEESKTNLVTASSDIAGYFTEQNSTATADASTAPDGTTTADLIVPNTTLGTHTSFTTSVSFTADTTYSYSIFVKPNGYNWLQLLFTSGFGNLPAWVNFNLTGAGSFGFTGGGELSKSIQAYPNGWYRCTITATSDSSVFAGGPAYLALDSDRNSRDASYAGNNTSGLYLWGAQLEAGSFPTSYIPTEGTTVTRAADVASNGGASFSSWYKQAEGTFFAEVDSAMASGAANTRILQVGDGTNANRQDLAFASGALLAFVNTANSVQVNAVTTNSAQANTNTRLAYAYKQDDFAWTLNAGTIKDNPGGTPPTVDRLGIGQRLDTTGFLNGHIKRLAYWSQRLPNPTLQTITQ